MLNNIKFFLLSICFIVIVPFVTFGQSWTAQSVPTITTKYTWVFATDSMHAYATAFDTKNVMQTFDGGTTWSAYELSTTNMDLLDVFFLDEDNGWIVGVDLGTFANIMFKTIDGGVSWQNISSTISTIGTTPNCIRYITPMVGYIGGEFSAGVYITVDGGQTWSTQNVPWPSGDPQYSKQVLRISTSQTGFITMLGIDNLNTGFVFSSDNNFKNSISINLLTGSGATIRDAFNIDNTGYVVSSDGIHKTANSGANWNQILSNSNFNANLTPLTTWFITPNIGWIAGYHQSGNSTSIMKTIDGGNTWLPELSGSQVFNSISLIKSNNNSIHGWAVGNNGVIFKYSDNSNITTGVDYIQLQRNDLDVFPNPTNGIFTITTNDKNIIIYDILGKKVPFSIIHENNTKTQLDFTDQKPGIYFVTTNESSIKVIKE